MGENAQELNEMELLEQNIIRSYNEILKELLEEGDMDTLEKVITDDAFRSEKMEEHSRRMRLGKRWSGQ